MKREIKFRGKVKHYDPMTNPENGWVEGYYLQDLTQGEMRSYIFQPPCSWEIIPETVGQFTGLMDKNGNKIYEGDIMNDPTSMCVGVVEWNSILCQFQLSWQNMHTAADLFFMVKCGSFVIGNIHDNLELLKKKHYETRRRNTETN